MKPECSTELRLCVRKSCAPTANQVANPTHFRRILRKQRPIELLIPIIRPFTDRLRSTCDSRQATIQFP